MMIDHTLLGLICAGAFMRQVVVRFRPAQPHEQHGGSTVRLDEHTIRHHTELIIASWLRLLHRCRWALHNKSRVRLTLSRVTFGRQHAFGSRSPQPHGDDAIIM